MILLIPMLFDLVSDCGYQGQGGSFCDQLTEYQEILEKHGVRVLACPLNPVQHSLYRDEYRHIVTVVSEIVWEITRLSHG